MEHPRTIVSEPEPKTVSVKPATVTVTAKSVSVAPWVCFSMAASYSQGGGKQNGEELEFDKGPDEFELLFTLDDKTKPKLDLAFFPDVTQAMWVTVGQAKPTKFDPGAIVPGFVNKKMTELTVTNRNGKREELTFVLRFTGKPSSDGTTTYVYDPKIVNGGHV